MKGLQCDSITKSLSERVLLKQSPSGSQVQKITRLFMGHDCARTNPHPLVQCYTYSKLEPGGVQYGPEAVTFLS